jgi:hypothetical protein
MAMSEGNFRPIRHTGHGKRASLRAGEMTNVETSALVVGGSRGAGAHGIPGKVERA